MKVTQAPNPPYKRDPCQYPFPGYEGLSRRAMVLYMRGETARRSLFTSEGPYSLLTVEKLARQGFIPCKRSEDDNSGTPEVGEVLCAFCRIQIADWQDEDNIRRIHQEESPFCLAAFEELGPRYLYRWDSNDRFAFRDEEDRREDSQEEEEEEDRQDQGQEEEGDSGVELDGMEEEEEDPEEDEDTCDCSCNKENRPPSPL